MQKNSTKKIIVVRLNASKPCAACMTSPPPPSDQVIRAGLSEGEGLRTLNGESFQQIKFFFVGQQCKKIMLLLMPVILLAGCSKNDTRYFDDTEAPGVAIFSDNGNNIMSCFIADAPWRTISRTTGAFSTATQYEVIISKGTPGVLQDSLLFTWQGYFQGKANDLGYLTLHLAISRNFSFRDLSALEGQRLSIDSINSFFSTNISNINSGNSKGKGNIYFHTASFDSIAPNSYTGRMAGLFDADFGSFKIISGRFDHVLTTEQVRF